MILTLRQMACMVKVSPFRAGKNLVTSFKSKVLLATVDSLRKIQVLIRNIGNNKLHVNGKGWSSCVAHLPRAGTGMMAVMIENRAHGQNQPIKKGPLEAARVKIPRIIRSFSRYFI